MNYSEKSDTLRLAAFTVDPEAVVALCVPSRLLLTALKSYSSGALNVGTVIPAVLLWDTAAAAVDAEVFECVEFAWAELEWEECAELEWEECAELEWEECTELE